MRRVKPPSVPPDILASDSAALGAAIRAARTSAGMTLTDAAMVLGIARQTLINLETGKGGSIDTALRAAREFGVAILAVPGGRQGAVRRALESVMQPGQPATPAELTDGQP